MFVPVEQILICFIQGFLYNSRLVGGVYVCDLIMAYVALAFNIHPIMHDAERVV